MTEPLIHHPNREKAESKAMKSIVVLLLIVSAAIVLVITIGGWSALQGGQPFAFVYAFLNLLFAYYVSRWNRGVLTVAAALAVLFGVLALVAGPSWFSRDKEGFDDPALDPAMLGLLTFALVPVQALLVAFCARAFGQRWNVEIEVDPDDPYYDAPTHGRPAPLGA
ncbi:MAG TPA: hypothetical protein VHF90_06375 [Thermoleophilaceae bacterium]|nr:hypothetical protein [Thermoleophilaceae bacterium]